MQDNRSHAEGWFAKAESDLADARRTLASEEGHTTPRVSTPNRPWRR